MIQPAAQQLVTASPEPYYVEVYGSGSSGNCVVINGDIMLDCGLAHKHIEKPLNSVSAVFISHRHGDHCHLGTLKWMEKTNPALLEYRTFVNADTASHLATKAQAISRVMNTPIIDDLFEYDIPTQLGTYHISTFPLKHDVENYGFVIEHPRFGRLLYATDTTTLKHAPHVLCDTVLLEGNWDEAQVKSMIESGGDDSRRALHNMRHLSVDTFETSVRRFAKKDAHIGQMHVSKDVGRQSPLDKHDDPSIKWL